MTNEVTRRNRHASLTTFVPQTARQREIADNIGKLAKMLIRRAPEIIGSEASPFPSGAILVLTGPPGRGKSHLMEGLIGDVLTEAPGLESKILLSRESLFSNFGSAVPRWHSWPLVFLDDVFSDEQSVSSLRIGSIMAFMNLITWVYEGRRLAVLTTNFPILDGLTQKILEADQIGRTVSRMKELWANAGEFELDGGDYREKIAAGRRSGFKLLES